MSEPVPLGPWHEQIAASIRKVEHHEQEIVSHGLTIAELHEEIADLTATVQVMADAHNALVRRVEQLERETERLDSLTRTPEDTAGLVDKFAKLLRQRREERGEE